MVMNSWSAFLSSCSWAYPLHREEVWALGKSQGGFGQGNLPQERSEADPLAQRFPPPTFPKIPCKLPAHAAALNAQVTCKQPRQEEGEISGCGSGHRLLPLSTRGCAAVCIWQRCRVPSCQQLCSAGQAFPGQVSVWDVLSRGMG